MAYIVCVKCQTFFHPKKNGVLVEEGRPIGPTLDGKPDWDTGWGPYKIWRADLLECRSCGAEIIAGFAHQPIAEHFMPEYEPTKERLGVHTFVKDCP